jgi:hypothetical protein
MIASTHHHEKDSKRHNTGRRAEVDGIGVTKGIGQWRRNLEGKETRRGEGGFQMRKVR